MYFVCIVKAIFKFRGSRSLSHYRVVNNRLLLSVQKSSIPLGANHLCMIRINQRTRALHRQMDVPTAENSLWTSQISNVTN